MPPLKSISRSTTTRTKKRKSTRYTDEEYNQLSPERRLKIIDEYVQQQENFPPSSYFSYRFRSSNLQHQQHPNLPNRKRKRCKLKNSIRGKIQTSKKYPRHLFQKNGKVWLKEKNSKLYCTCHVYLKKNPSYAQCKYHDNNNNNNNNVYEYNHKILYEVFHDNKKIPKGMQIDHINNNTKDNRLKNLRLLTKNQNMQNRRSKKNARSKFKGVTFNKESKRKPWKARINYNKKQKYLGSYATEMQAFQAYKREARRLNKKQNTKFIL